MPQTPKTSQIDVEQAVQRAIVEIWTLKKCGKPLAPIHAKVDLSGAALIQLSRSSNFVRDAAGRLSLALQDSGLQDEILRSLGHVPDGKDNFTVATGTPLLRVDEQYIKGDRYQERPYPEYDPDSDELDSEVIEESLAKMNEQGNGVSEAEGSPHAMTPTAGSNFSMDQSWRQVPILDAPEKFAVRQT